VFLALFLPYLYISAGALQVDRNSGEFRLTVIGVVLLTVIGSIHLLNQVR
jgi:hypothetical protein